MAKDVIVVVNIDAKPKAAETLDILLVSTEGVKPLKVYRDLETIKADFPAAKVYSMAAAMFEQGKTTLAESLIRKIKIVGIAAPESAAGMVEAIEGLRETNDDWYMLLTDQTEEEYVKALAAWAEASEPTEAELGAGVEDHRKIYVCQTTNKAIACTNRRSVIIYTDSTDEWADAATVGNVGPFYPEAVTWKFKRPQGLTVPDLTEGEKQALEEANINFLTTEYKREYIKNGTCADGEFIDVQLGADYLAYTMRNNLYDVFLKNAKVPYTDGGFSLVAGAVVSALNRCVELGVIARDSESGQGVFTVIIPKRSEATDEESRARKMPDITWEALLEGAVHGVKVKGTLKATLSA